MVSEITGVEIKGIVTVFPDNQVDNNDFYNLFGEKEVKKQIKLTGITKRYCIKEPQVPSDLCLAAAERLLDKTKVSRESIKVLIYVTAYTDFVIPSTAIYLQNALKLSDECISFDVNLGCSAFINGSYIVSGYLERMNKGDRALLLISDTVNYGGEFLDKTTSMLSSDCGTATIFEKTDTNQKILFQQRFDGSRYDALVRDDLRHNLYMDGMAVFQFTISDVVDDIKRFISDNRINVEAMDYCVLHQAQKFIVDKVLLFSGLPKEKNIISYDKCGNSGGSSVPVTICFNRQIIQKKDKASLLVTGFGSGLAWGIMYFTMPTSGICDVEYTNIHYEKSGEK